MIRGFAAPRSGASSATSGRTSTRTLLYILLPLSIVGALVLVSQGVIQTLGRLRDVHDRSPAASRRSRSGPVASQIAIKQLGTNGGGFFNVN